MRYILGILVMLFLVGFVACTMLLGGPPAQVHELRDVILGGALVCATLSAVMLGMLVLGVGAKGKKISSWRVPLLCAITLLVSLILGVFILTVEPMNLTEQHIAMTTSIRICALVMIAFGLFSLGGLIAALISAKRHNSKLA